MAMWINITVFAVIFFVVIHCSHQGSDHVLDDLLKKATGVYASSPKSSVHPLENTVLLTASNYSAIKFLYNLKCFLDRLDFKFIVLSLDFALYNDLVNNDESILSYPIAASAQINPLAASSSKMQTHNELNKLESIYRVLERGYDVLFMEVDGVLLEDPAPYLQHPDLVFVHDSGGTCDPSAGQRESSGSGRDAGFFFIRSNPSTLAAVARAMQLAEQGVGQTAGDSVHSMLYKVFKNDQSVQYAGSCYSLLAGSEEGGGKAACALDPCLFSSGSLPISGKNLFLTPTLSPYYLYICALHCSI
ncbi:hypothetical protein EON64_12275 [archaeon]|nr:MAG: hypothetical protein EON64_12275 [archaeon]